VIIVNQMIFFDFQRKRLLPKRLNTNHEITNDGIEKAS